MKLNEIISYLKNIKTILKNQDNIKLDLGNIIINTEDIESLNLKSNNTNYIIDIKLSRTKLLFGRRPKKSKKIFSIDNKINKLPISEKERILSSKIRDFYEK